MDGSVSPFDWLVSPMNWHNNHLTIYVWVLHPKTQSTLGWDPALLQEEENNQLLLPQPLLHQPLGQDQQRV